jgi:hypothetical protein
MAGLKSNNISWKTLPIRILTLAGLVLMFTSCYSKYVFIDYEIHHGAVMDETHNCAAFVASRRAWLSPKGVARLPDGGIPQYLLQDVGLYVFNFTNGQLKHLTGFDDLTEILGSYSSKWDVKLAYNDSVVNYLILPANDWSLHMKQAGNQADSSLVFSLKEKYSNPYSFNIKNNAISEIDTSFFQELHKKSAENNYISLTDLNKRLSEVPLSDWGLIVQKINPKPDKEYIEETIYLHNNSKMTRRAVIEQIIAKMSKSEIEELLKKMDEYKNKLEGLKRSEYELYSKDTYEKIRSKLN